MSLLEELRNRVRDRPARPDVLTIRADQFQQLADELNALNANSVSDVPKITAEDIRRNGCWVFGIPVRAQSLAAGQASPKQKDPTTS